MIVWNGVERVPAGTDAVVATIGNFDGVHLGHQTILKSTIVEAKRRGLRPLVITFDPHPLRIVHPERAPKLLMTRRQKLLALEALGLDAVLVLPFSAELAALGGRAFFQRLLGSSIRLAAVHVGENFRFGRGREGELGLLRTIGRERGFDVVGVAPISVDGEVVSSSAIRRLVEAGEVDRALRFIGRPFAVTGEVVRGAGRGRTLAFPTANLDVENDLLPRLGVYVTETVVRALRVPSVTNVGTRPTFDGSQVTVESHLIDFDEDLYGERAEVRFLGRIRDEMRFAGANELADQIARDLGAAAAFFHNIESSSR